VSRDLDVLVAGGGVAGLTAGLTAARLGHSTLVLTGGAPGGLLLSIERIEGYPGFPDGVPGYELCPLLQEQAEAAGAGFSMETVSRLGREKGGWRVDGLTARTVIIATGARLKKLRVPGEERLAGKGVSHCATCDGPIFRDRPVGVVGGGDSALQEALTLADFASAVTVLQLGDELTGQASYRERVLGHPKVEVRYESAVEEIAGGDAVEGVRLADGVELALDAVFVYVGLEPNSQLLEGHAGERGLFAAGIVREGAVGRAAAAAGEGASAAIAADRYLANGGRE
jgi:thioredoxin reductase (NADPH)